MNVSLQDKKKEALRRMRKLGICSAIIADFQRNNNVQIFETGLGIGYWANDKLKSVIEEFEKECNALVFSGIKSTLDICGDIQTHWSLLYVSDHKDEWGYNNADLKQNLAIAYVFNETYPYDSEIGYIGVRKTVAGGLVRTA